MTFKSNIGIIGIQHSGKTVFLMSLLSHLKNYHGHRLQLKTDDPNEIVDIIKFKEITEGIDLPFFELEKYRNSLLANRRWPKKTSDFCYYRCQFQRTDWMSNIDLTFLDFPGERFNDAIMLVGNGTYEEWSDAVIKRMEEDPQCEQLAEEYFQLLAKQAEHPPKIEQIILAYKRTLARFMSNYGAFITPSVFALDTEGRQPKYSENLDEIAKSALIGRTINSQFAPLPASFRENNPDITDIFSKHYQDYRHEIVEKPFKILSACEKLLVLIDIPGLLAANVGRYNDTQTILNYVLKATVKEDGGFFKKLVNFLSSGRFSMNHIESIAFIGTKSDMVNYPDLDNLEQLLQEMVKSIIKNYPHINHDYFVCSAIRSTLMKENKLLGYPLYDVNANMTQQPHPDDLMTELNPSTLPDTWPDYWETHKYYFPEVWPRVPSKKDVPPNQIGLDDILNFIFEK